MLGLCWKPATIQGMQKVARSMPSNPEQLLGAILVRRDIFQRFESTMQDTCLDANNLLEYLFSLYNSTAAPTERENFQSNQNIRPQPFSGQRRDSGPNKKSPGNTPMRQLTPKTPGGVQQNAAAGHQQQQQQQQGIPEIHITDSHHHHRKRAKLDQQQQNLATLTGHNNVGGTHHTAHQQTPTGFQQQQQQQHPLQPAFENAAVFPGSNSIKMEMGHQGQDAESRHQQSSSPLPPFSQIRRQQGRPFSPGSAQVVGQGSQGQQQDSSTPDRKFTNPEGRFYQGLADGSVDQSRVKSKSNSTPLKDNNSDFPRRKKPKRHQCFCGALFTRADNLKRHIRKCHEEKLEKLANASVTNAEGETPTNPNQFDDFQQLYPTAGTDLQPAAPNQEMQQQQQQQQQQLQDADHAHQQQEVDQHALNDVDMAAMSKAGAAAGVKWSCFCGESFEDHRQLVEHTRIHEGNA